MEDLDRIKDKKKKKEEEEEVVIRHLDGWNIIKFSKTLTLG